MPQALFVSTSRKNIWSDELPTSAAPSAGESACVYFPSVLLAARRDHLAGVPIQNQHGNRCCGKASQPQHRKLGQEHGARQKSTKFPGAGLFSTLCFPSRVGELPPGPAASAPGSGKCPCAGLSGGCAKRSQPPCFPWTGFSVPCPALSL